jgi:hypothetical protein
MKTIILSAEVVRFSNRSPIQQTSTFALKATKKKTKKFLSFIALSLLSSSPAPSYQCQYKFSQRKREKFVLVCTNIETTAPASDKFPSRLKELSKKMF